MEKLEQINALKNGHGIQYLIDEGYRILGNPINMFDADYNRVANADATLDDPLWNELVHTGTFCLESRKFFMDECFTDVVANAKKLAVMKSDKLKYGRASAHIFNGDGIKVANLLMIAGYIPFDEDSLAAFEALAYLITREISNDLHYIEYGERYQGQWIKKLIARDIEEKGMYSPQVQILYNGFKAHLYLAAVDISSSYSFSENSDAFIVKLRNKRKDFKYAFYDNYVVVLMSSDYKNFKVQRELGDIALCIEQENIFAGISSSFDNLFNLHIYYADAVKALAKAKDNGVNIYPRRRKSH